MLEFFKSLAYAYGSLGLVVQASIVVGMSLVTTAFGVAMVVWIPPDHFKSQKKEPASWWKSHPLLRGSGLLLKNVVGEVFFVLGFVMALPLVPGPGLVFMLLGLSLLDFPGKRNAERRLLAVPSVIRFLNEVRFRFGRAPLALDEPDEPPA